LCQQSTAIRSRNVLFLIRKRGDGNRILVFVEVERDATLEIILLRRPKR
jgi:hypothetical protein